MTTDNDQAAVDALCMLTYTSDQEGEPHDCVEGADAARAILDAIREGRAPIPGMVTEAVWRAAEAEVERLARLLRESNRLIKDAKRLLGPRTTNSDADVAIARNEAALAEVGK